MGETQVEVRGGNLHELSAVDELMELLQEARAVLDWEAAMGNRFLPEGIVTVRECPDAVTNNVQTAPGQLQERVRQLALLQEQARTCKRCTLHQGRSQSVFARGGPTAQIAFVGEGPDVQEDQEGIPFVGQAGQLLDKMVAAMGLGRDEVYICNVVKCRLPENQTPRPEDASECIPFLEGQLQAVQPKVVVALGKTAATYLGCADDHEPWRGRWTQWRGIPVMSTFHPVFLLREPSSKRQVWEDLQQVMKRIGNAP